VSARTTAPPTTRTAPAASSAGGLVFRDGTRRPAGGILDGEREVAMVRRNLSALVALLLLAGVAVATTGCENTEPSPEVRKEVVSAVRTYLDRLAQAYSEMDATLLEGYATEGEIRDTQALLHKLRASGDRVEASLLRMDVLDVQVFRVVNATVTLLEVWDVRRLDYYTGKEKGHNPGTIQHSIIQLRKIDGKWMVTARRVQETNRPGKWKVATPVPGGEASGEAAASPTEPAGTE